MARAPAKSDVGFVLGAMQLGIGIALLGWVLLANVSIESGFAVARWVLLHSPVELPGTAEQFAEAASDSSGLMGIGIVGAVIICLGIDNLWPVSRSATVRRKGRFRLELDAPARLGQWFEGKVVVLRRARAGDAYDVRLGCSRQVKAYREGIEGSESYDTTELRYDQRVRSEAVPSAKGLAVPFRFEIPADMPETGSGPISERFQWKLKVGPADAFFPTTFPVDVRRLKAEDVRNPIPATNPDAPARNWTHVEPTPREARARAFSDRVFNRDGRWQAFLVYMVTGVFVVFLVLAIANVLLKAVLGSR